MYLLDARLTDIKCFRDVRLQFRSAQTSDDRQSNWNVIVGNNGHGKTTLLQALAGCTMDVTTAQGLLRPDRWVRRDAEVATMSATIVQEPDDKQRGRPPKEDKDRYTVKYAIVSAGSQFSRSPAGRPSSMFFSTTQMLEPSFEFPLVFGIGDERDCTPLVDDIDFLKRNAFARDVQDSNNGWLSCGYGAFRRLSGFSSQSALIDDPRQQRHLTLFREGAALLQCESWLKELDRQASKSRQGSPKRKTLDEVKRILLDVLPEVQDIHLDDDVRFEWRHERLDVAQLSDGYRTVFGLIVDLLRWLEIHRPDAGNPLNEGRGVVFIDEIDAHLHPRWQREIGFHLTRLFPNIQFIVTSHSPFVAMSTGEGALTILEADGDVVRARQASKSPRGWAIERVLRDLFALPVVTDPDTERLLEQYEQLRQQKLSGSLTREQQIELMRLRHILDSRMAGDDAAPVNAERKTDLQELLRLVDEQAKR